MGGDNTAHLKPEERAEIRIGAWLIENKMEIYTNRRGAVSNSLVCGVFNISGECREKPDMIFTDGRDWFVIEIKSGVGSSKDMRNSRKIVNYYKNFIEGRTKYFISGNEIKPNCFLIASFYSPEGKLSQDDTPRTDSIDSQKAQIQGRPQQEYNEAYCLARQIWDEWKEIKKPCFTVGVLLSDKLNKGAGKPAIFIQEFNTRRGMWYAHRFYVMGVQP